MTNANPLPRIPNLKSPKAISDLHQFSAARVAGFYFVAGILWILLSDLFLAGSGGLTPGGVLISMSKGGGFVVVSACLVYWLCRREWRKTTRAEGLLHIVVEGTSDAVFVKDFNGRYQLVNTAAAKFIGRSTSEILGRDDFALFGAEDAKQLTENDRAIMAGGVVVTLEEALTSAGASRTYLATKAPFLNEIGEVGGLIGISRDISDRKKVELALRESEERFRSMSDAAPVLMWVSDTSGNCVWFNRRWTEFSGRSIDREIGIGWVEGVHPDDKENCLHTYQTAFDARLPFEMDYRLRRHDGEYRWVLDTGVPRITEGEFAGYIGSCVDITDRKLAADALRESEERYRELADAIPQIVWTAGPDGILIQWNARAAKYFGRDTNSLVGWSWDDAIHPDDLPMVVDAWADAVANGVPCDFEFRILRADGEYRWHVNRQVPARAADGSVSRWYGTCTDIHDLKQVETAFRETDARLREAQRIAKLGSWSWDPPTDTVWWSDAEFELFRVDRNLVSPSFNSFLELIHPEDRGIAIARVEAMIAGENEFANDLRIVRPDGSNIWIHSCARATRDASGTIIRVEGTDQDVTADRLAQASARESENRLQAAVEVAGLGIIDVDYHQQTAVLSARAVEQFGLRQASITRDELHSRFHPDDCVELMSMIESAMDPSGTGLFVFEHRVQLPDGKTRWLNACQQVSFVNGRPDRAVVVTADVTDPRIAEEALKASERRYRLLFESNPHPMWVYHVESLKFLAVNDAAVLSYGYSREEFLAMTIRDIRPAEDLQLLESAIARLTPDPTQSTHWRHRRKNGSIFDVEISSHELHDEGNSRLVLAMNVTERLQAERELRAERDRFEKIMETVPVAICSLHLGVDGKVTMPYASPSIESIYGISPSELASDASRVFTLIHPDDRLRVQESIADSARNMKLWRCEYRIQSPQGNEIWVEGSSSPTQLEDGTILWHGYVCDITLRKEADDTLRQSERQLRLALESAGAIAFVWDVQNDMVTRYFSTEPALPVTAEHLGTLAEVRGRIHSEDLAHFDARLSACLAKGSEYRNEYRVVRPDGSIANLEEYGYLDRAENDSPLRLTGMSIDITHRKQLEEQFRQAQKMDAVGRLAGGIAHDFNNLLTVINGFSEILLARYSKDDPARGPLSEILDAGNRAARLTQQLLSFSRKSVLANRIVDLNELIGESAKLIRRLIGEDIDLSVGINSGPVRVLVDPGQLEQVLMNLALNSRDAMPTGGRLCIETRIVELTSIDKRTYPILRPGFFATLKVTDTGVGMSKEIIDKIFEPFFTTKGMGKGTGLGLAVVHGVVQQAGGWVEVQSELGTGTSVTVFLPATSEGVRDTASNEMMVDPRGNETVLVVEDEAAVRSLVRDALKAQGYKVLTAQDGKDGLELLSSYTDRVDLLVTDVIMPGISGRELAQKAQSERPKMRVLFMSGYTADALDRHGMQGEAEVHFIQKPFTPLGLVKCVREILDRSENHPA